MSLTRLDHVNKVLVVSTGSAHGCLDIILSTTILCRKTIQLRRHLAGHLDPALFLILLKVRGFNESFGKEAGSWSFRHGLCTECDGSVLVFGNTPAFHGWEEETKVIGRLDLGDLANVSFAGFGGLEKGDGQGREGEGCNDFGHFRMIGCFW